MVDRVTQIRRTTSILNERLGREPTDEELADEMNLPVNRITLLKSVSQKPASTRLANWRRGRVYIREIVQDDKATSLSKIYNLKV